MDISDLLPKCRWECVGYFGSNKDDTPVGWKRRLRWLGSESDAFLDEMAESSEVA